MSNAVEVNDADFEAQIEQHKGLAVVDFWATWCAPCVAEVPNVRSAYEKLHDKGFEIIGLSFDQEMEALEKFVTKQKMAWPQYFDGKGWQNQFGQEFGIASIPTMWLVDKKGVLRDMNARDALESKVEKLLAE
jgi:thiol-disulfide isomerase/thioredoxin